MIHPIMLTYQESSQIQLQLRPQIQPNQPPHQHHPHSFHVMGLLTMCTSAIIHQWPLKTLQVAL